MKIVLVLLAVLIGGYAALVGWLYFNQRKLQYFPTHRDASGKGEGEFLPWASKDGEFMGYVRPAGQMRALVLFFHGNAGEALDRTWFSQVIPDDVGLILTEYPGFGAKPGDSTQAELLYLVPYIVRTRT